MELETLDDSLHFLIVDDDEDSRATVVDYLKAMGYMRFTEASNGSQALHLLEKDLTLNFIISDWDMPMMNGFSLLQKVKSNPNRAHIPFLVMTSPVSEESEKVVMAAENLVDAYLIKPFRSQLLLEKIKKVLTIAALGFRKKIVVVDDDEDAREMIVDYVKEMGFRDILPFSDGLNALHYIKEHSEKVGLIISDWEMPKMTGIELLRTCKSSAILSKIPFLMVTSQTSIERMKIMQAARASVDQYLLKPFKSDEFRLRIEEVLEKARTMDDVREMTRQGVENYEDGSYQAAKTQFESALKVQPKDEAALMGMAETVAKHEGWGPALPFFKEAIEVNPVNAQNYLKLAHAYDQVGLFDQAIALLESAIHQVGFNVELHYALGKHYAKQNRLEEAEVEFRKVLEIQPDHQKARLKLETLASKRKGS